MPRRDVVITGIGIVSSLGSTLNAFAAALYETAGANGARFVAVKTQHAPSLPGARVGTEPMDAVDRGEALLADRSTLLALQASTRALADAAWPADAAALRGCGVFVGSGSGPTESVQASYKALHRNGRVPGLTLLRCLPCGAASAISIRHQLGGPTQTYANACASSALAIGEAMRAIRHGYLDVALAGGTETPFGDGSIKAWEALRVLAPLEDNAAAACRPFDRSRRGIVLGEGAVFFVLEAAEHAAARGARVRAAVAGYAAASDARHITEPSSQGQVRAMQDALEDAGLPPRDIGSVNAHGTGTLVGDQVEAASIATVFGAGPRAHS